MLRWLTRFRLPLWRWRPPPETSRVIVGSAGSGKSEGELIELVRTRLPGCVRERR